MMFVFFLITPTESWLVEWESLLTNDGSEKKGGLRLAGPINTLFKCVLSNG